MVTNIFLLKEIHEQPTILRQTISKYICDNDGRINFNLHEEDPVSNHMAKQQIALSENEIRGIEHILICHDCY